MNNVTNRLRDVILMKTGTCHSSDIVTALQLSEGEWEEEEEAGVEEINIADEVIRVAVPPKKGFSTVDKVSVGVVGPEILRSFPLNFKFFLPDNTPIGEFVGKPNDATIKEAAAILGLSDISRNKYSYWMADVTQEMLTAAQRRGMSQINQVNTLNWFIFILKQIQLTSLPRKDFFARLEEMLLGAEKIMVSKGSETIPIPSEVLTTQEKDAFFVYYPYSPPEKVEVKKGEQDAPDPAKLGRKKSRQSTSKERPQIEVLVEEEVEYSEEEGEFFDLGPPPITEKDLMTMAQLLYDVFADRLAYEIIRDVFWEEPLVEVVRISERILPPKMLVPEDNEFLKALETEPYSLESAMFLDELLLPGEKLEDLTDEEKAKRIKEAAEQRSKDRFMQPLADAIDSAYYRKIYPDVKGISKFVFIKKKKMEQYRREHSSKKPLSLEKTKAGSPGRKSKAGGERRKSSKRKSRASTGGKRKSTAKQSKRQSMKRKSKAK